MTLSPSGSTLGPDGSADVVRSGRPGNPIDFQNEVRGREHCALQVVAAVRVGVLRIEIRERVRLELIQEVRALRARQIVEAVAVLQCSSCYSKMKLNVGPSMPPNSDCCFGQAADPQIDIVQAAAMPAA